MTDEDDKKRAEEEAREKAKKETEEAAAAKAAEDSSGGGKGKEENPLKEAKSINEEKAKLLDREEALQSRKEKFEAERLVGGGSQAGQAQPGKEPETDEAFVKRFEAGDVKLFDDNK